MIELIDLYHNQIDETIIQRLCINMKINNALISLQVFSILFFFMLFILGIGSNIAMCSSAVTVIRDQFPRILAWQAAIGVAIVGFLLGLIYATPVRIRMEVDH